MPEPRIETHIKNDKQMPLRPFLVAGVPLLILFACLLLSFFKGCTDLGKASRQKIYDPTQSLAEDEGFVGRSNTLLAELLNIVDPSVEATCLDSLNKRYLALEFALPYGEEHKATIEAADLRLVGIHPEYIKDDKLRRFYYNSRLPQLLQQQDEQKGETYFRFQCRGKKGSVQGTRPIEVTSIKLIPSMFKVMLSKNPWKGTIYGPDNCLFATGKTIFLTYGNSVLPLRNEQHLTRENPVFFRAVMQDGTLLTPQGKIDYYDYYLKAFKDEKPHAVNIGLRNSSGERDLASFLISYSNDSIFISHSADIAVVSAGQSTHYKRPERGSQRPSVVPFHDGMKLLVYDDEARKLGEFSLYRQNPSRILSCLVQSSTGTSRFIIGEEQTDLFTQQMLRGLSRHLSNRDNVDSVALSIDPMLSREFENEIYSYLHSLRDDITKQRPRNQVKEQYDMSLTIMDIATGDVLATPFYTTLFDYDDFPDILRLTTRNASLSRRSIGSVFKPMVALASVLATPSLLDMDTQNPHRYSPPADWSQKKPIARFFGRDTHAWAKKSASHWNGCDFTTFLSRSDDVYPVALTALAMTGEPVDGKTVTTLPLTGNSNFFELGKDKLLRFKKSSDNENINTRDHVFTDWLAYLYDTSYDKDYAADLNLFAHLLEKDSLDADQKNFGLEEVSPELTSLRMDRFYDGDDFKARLVPWVLGQGDNMWNCSKVAEAWCRMVSKRDVKASFIKHATRNDSLPSLIRDGAQYPGSTLGQRSVADINSTWNGFLNKLHSAQNGSSLLGQMRTAVTNLNNAEHANLTLFSKTGTPDAYVRYEFPLLGGNNRYVDVGLYAFALMDNDQYNSRVLPLNAKDNPAGIVCVVRITRSYECHRCRPGHQCGACESFWGLKSSHARDFFSASSRRMQKLYDMTRNYFTNGKK